MVLLVLLIAYCSSAKCFNDCPREQLQRDSFLSNFAASRFSISDDDDHVARCHNVGARHLRDQVSGRYSVVVPVNLVPARRVKTENEPGTGFSNQVDHSGAGSVDVDLSFGCLNTCLGAEYSLRNWNIIITLEKRLAEYFP